MTEIEKEREKIIEYIFSWKSHEKNRVSFFENEFLLWCIYHFPWDFVHVIADFQKEYAQDLSDWLDVFFVWFRWCSKSTLLTMYYAWVIIYQKRRFIIHYNSEINQAKSMITDVINYLQDTKTITTDHWYKYLPPTSQKRIDKKKKTVWEFLSEDWVKMKAMSIWKSPRWQKFVWKGVTYRPDLVWFDDIDNDKNIKNPDIIESDILFLTWEVFGWLEAYAQKIFLWNVIAEDWRIPRLKKHFESDVKNKVKVFWIPIRKKWKILWSRYVATDKEAEELNKNIKINKDKFISIESKRREQWSIWFNQNFNLIAYKKWQRIIKESDIKYYGTLPKNHKIIIWIDPAFSEKTWSDAIGLTITAQEMFEKEIHKYVIEIREFNEEEKDEEFFCKVVKELYQKYKCNLVYIENNNGWWILARMLKKRWLGVIIINSEKDKITRLREYQWEFERWLIKFNPDLSKVQKWIQQLMEFPAWAHDDMVDSMVFSFTPYSGWIIRAF